MLVLTMLSLVVWAARQLSHSAICTCMCARRWWFLKGPAHAPEANPGTGPSDHWPRHGMVSPLPARWFRHHPQRPAALEAVQAETVNA